MISELWHLSESMSFRNHNDKEGENTEKRVNKFKKYNLQADEAERETAILHNSLTFYLHL